MNTSFPLMGKSWAKWAWFWCTRLLTWPQFGQVDARFRCLTSKIIQSSSLRYPVTSTSLILSNSASNEVMFCDIPASDYGGYSTLRGLWCLTVQWCSRFRGKLGIKGTEEPEVAKVQGYEDGLRSLFISSRRFSIYGTQILQEFYVALIKAILPSYDQDQKKSIQYRIKKPQRVDENLIRTLKPESAERYFLDSTKESQNTSRF